MNRFVTIGGVAVAQLALVGLAVAPQLSARLTGETYTMAVAPLDPIDPFRGAYVTLDYPGLTSRLDREVPPENLDDDPTNDVWEDDTSVTDLSGDVFVPLVEDGGVWRPDDVLEDRPSDGPYLSCHANGWSVSCGIESFFTSQDRARELESQLAAAGRGTEMVADVQVDRWGNARVVDVRPANADGRG